MSTKKKSNHKKRKVAAPPLGPGEARVTEFADKAGGYTRVVVEYRTRAKDQDGLGRTLLAAMQNAAAQVDVSVYARQREHEIIDGELLTPDGGLVIEKWLPETDRTLTILKARPATIEDQGRLKAFGESDAQAAQRHGMVAKLAEQRASEDVLALATSGEPDDGEVEHD